jgi:hypothetical protein
VRSREEKLGEKDRILHVASNWSRLMFTKWPKNHPRKKSILGRHWWGAIYRSKGKRSTCYTSTGIFLKHALKYQNKVLNHNLVLSRLFLVKIDKLFASEVILKYIISKFEQNYFSIRPFEE